jgi:hypothetical protein
VTVQFYKATSNGVVSEDDMAQITRQVERVYKDADYVGSLVTEGETGRPTEHAGPKTQPPDWWHVFWMRYEQSTGRSRLVAQALLRQRMGKGWFPHDEKELQEALRRLSE